jgi:hypothetical protein
MNSLSSQPFFTMCHIMPMRNAMSVPGRRRTYSVAWAAVRVKRGSATMKFARLISLPASQCWTEIGCASAGVPPRISMVFELRRSL